MSRHGALASTRCDRVSYTVGKGKTSMLKTLKELAFRGYPTGWGRRVFLRQSGAVELFIAALYGQPSSSAMAQALYDIMYTRKHVHVIMSLSPSDLIIYLHLKRVHFQILLREAANHYGSLGVSISLRIWLGDQIYPSMDKANCSYHLLTLLSRRCVPHHIDQERG